MPIIRRNNCVFATLGTCYSVWMTFWYAGWNEFRSTLHTRQSSTQNNKCQISQKHSCFSWWWAHIRPKHVEIDKYTKNKFCTKFVLLTAQFTPAPSCFLSHRPTLPVIMFVPSVFDFADDKILSIQFQYVCWLCCKFTHNSIKATMNTSDRRHVRFYPEAILFQHKHFSCVMRPSLTFWHRSFTFNSNK